MGGHYDRGDPSPDSDIWIECFCSECKQDPSPGLPGKRILCREFEKHGGEIYTHYVVFAIYIWMLLFCHFTAFIAALL